MGFKPEDELAMLVQEAPQRANHAYQVMFLNISLTKCNIKNLQAETFS